jgi:FkbM family methyltransferase
MPKLDPRGQTNAVIRVFERIGRKGSTRLGGIAVQCARAVIRGFEGAGAVLLNISTNGEARVLNKFGPALHVVFDVGANEGEWTEAALAAGAESVHSFEISPSTSAELVARYANDDRVTVNAFGLSDNAGTVTIRHFPDFPKLTTVTDFPWDIPAEEIEVPVRTGDDYLAESGVDTIDFLKLDVEGAEQDVLRGFAKAFDRGAIGAVQFEYGRFVVLTKYMLRDFYEDLTAWGFVLGQIRPNSWEPTPFNMAMETLTDANYLAVHTSRKDLLDLLG